MWELGKKEKKAKEFHFRKCSGSNKILQLLRVEGQPALFDRRENES